MGLKRDHQFWGLVNSIIIGAFVGGKALHLLLYVPFSRGAYWDLAFDPNHGFSILGDISGGALAAVLFCRAEKLEIARLMDYLFQVVPVMDAIGRWGCLGAGCCYGRPASVPWAITFTNPGAALPDRWLGIPLHPTQLYESGADALIASFLYVTILPRIEKGDLKRGTLSALYLGLYAVLRFTDEFFRGDVNHLPIGITSAQAFSLGLLALSAVSLSYLYRRSPSHASRPR
jgi:phosphatidylglycerol:prolipoprotein diacylglycerol transferase